jgi:hypothetical protein
MLDQLKEPFPKSELQWRKGRSNTILAYIDARCVMKRLDDVVGIDGWQDSYKSIDGRTMCELSIRINGEWVTKSDGAGDTNIEGEKGGISDAFKRAAVKFGVGRYLYYIPNGCRSFEDLPDTFKPGGGRIMREQCQDSLIVIKQAIIDQDLSTASEAWTELGRHEQNWIWHILSSKQKEAVRACEASRAA